MRAAVMRAAVMRIVLVHAVRPRLVLPRDVLPRSLLARSLLARSVPARSVPARSVPARSVPARSVPARSVPARDVLPRSVPARSVPARSVPARSVPARTDLVRGILMRGEHVVHGRPKKGQRPLRAIAAFGVGSRQVGLIQPRQLVGQHIFEGRHNPSGLLRRVRTGTVRVITDHPQRQLTETLLQSNRLVQGRPPISHVAGQRDELPEMRFVRAPPGQHRQQHPPPRGVLLGGKRLQIIRFLERRQELEQLLRPLVDLRRGLQQHRIGDRHRRLRAR